MSGDGRTVPISIQCVRVKQSNLVKWSEFQAIPETSENGSGQATLAIST